MRVRIIERGGVEGYLLNGPRLPLPPRLRELWRPVEGPMLERIILTREVLLAASQVRV